MKRTVFAALAAVLALSLASCVSSWSDGSYLVIGFGGARSFSAWPPTDAEIARMVVEVTLDGPGGVRELVVRGGTSITVPVETGRWRIDSRVVMDGDLCAVGDTEYFQVKEGRNNVNVTLRRPPALSLSVSATHVFPGESLGYAAAPAALDVSAANGGSVPTGDLSVSLSGGGASAFALSRTVLPGLAARIGVEGFAVRPKTGLAAGTHAATVTVGGEGLSASFDVSFTVVILPLSGTVGITGTAKPGQTLTADTAALGGSGSISHQWKRGGTNIGGATGATYTLAVADEGQTITVVVSRAGYSGTVESAATASVAGYAIGDTGPAGGIIFYVDSVDAYPGWKYLEAAPADASGTFSWGLSGTNVSTGTAIGSGKSNTNAILAAQWNAPAARACADYSAGGIGGWFLPSKDEHSEMYTHRVAIGAFTTSERYWCSSQDDNTRAWTHSFSDNNWSVGPKTNAYQVRPIRQF